MTTARKSFNSRNCIIYDCKESKRVQGIPLDTVDSILLYECLRRVITIDFIHIALLQAKYSIALPKHYYPVIFLYNFQCSLAREEKTLG